MRDKLTPRQVRAWSLCALSVPAAMALPGCGWLWVLGGSILACALAACQQAMQRRSGLSMRHALVRAFETGGGRIMAAAELLWLLFAASGAAAASQIAFEDDLGPFLPAIPLLLAALAGQKTEVDLKNVYVRNVRLIGSTLRSRAPEVKAQILRSLVGEVWPKVAAGQVRPTVTAVLPIEQAEAAHELLYKSESCGKVVLTVK